MANESKTSWGSVAGSVRKESAKTGDTVTRNRKVYTHVMTEPERFALQAVQRASSALRTINDAIKSGKKVNPDVVKLCFQLGQAVGDMLFTTD